MMDWRRTSLLSIINQRAHLPPPLMNPNQFTLKLQEAFRAAQSLANEKSHAELRSVHLFSALLDQPDGVTRPILSKIGADPDSLNSQVSTLLGNLPSVQGNAGQQVYLSSDLRAVMNTAEKIRGKMNDDFTSVEHVLLAIINEGNSDLKSLLQHLSLIHISEPTRPY